MLFAIGTMKPSVDMVGRLPEKQRHYNDPCEILYRNLFYRSKSKPTNAHGTYCTFFDATPTSLCTVYCIVACTPARHDCFTDASRTQVDGAFILQVARLRTVHIFRRPSLKPSSRSIAKPKQHGTTNSKPHGQMSKTKQPQLKQTEPKQPQPKQTEPKQPQPKQTEPKQKEATFTRLLLPGAPLRTPKPAF